MANQHPGVTIKEVDSGPRPIEGVGTACLGIIGFAPSGPILTPELVTNWGQFVEKFGALEEGGQRNPYIPGAYLAHAIYGFFANGGGRCYVARVGGDPRDKMPTSVQFFADKPGRDKQALLTVEAKGSPTQNIKVKLKPAEVKKGSSEEDYTFTLTVEMEGSRGPSTTEEYKKVSLRDGGGKNVVAEVTQKSRLVNAIEVSPADFSGPVRLAAAEHTIKGQLIKPLKRLLVDERIGMPSVPVKTEKESAIKERPTRKGEDSLKTDSNEVSTQEQPPFENGTEAPTHLNLYDFQGKKPARSGILGMELFDDITMVCCPDLMAAKNAGLLGDKGAADELVRSFQEQMIKHCETMGDRIAILDTPSGLGAKPAEHWRAESNYDSKYAAVYFPWLKVIDPQTGEKIIVPPSGHIAGIYARNDDERGVHKAPANEVIRAALDAEIPITNGEQDGLNPMGVNCLRSFPGRGLRVWGARTISSDPAWRYINVRRLFNYVEKSIERGTQWVVFEPNDHDLWARVRRDVTAFLIGVWREGALFGLTQDEAFFVKCDAENNPEDERDRGRLNIDVGLAAVKPAEFVTFRFSQYSGGGA